MNFIKKNIFFIALSIFLSEYSIATVESSDNNNELDSPHNLSIIIKRSVGPLDLSACSIDDNLACNISEIIKDNLDITSVNLNYNSIGNKGIKSLAQSFKNLERLESLYLYGNPIEDQGFAELVSVLKEAKSLIFIDLRKTKLGTAGAHMLAELLESNSNLRIHNPSLNRTILDEMFKTGC